MTANQTLAAIDVAILASQEPPHRMHLGASVIGKPCERELWYLFRWVLHEKHDARMLRLFNRGHLEEKRFVNYLRSIGVEVWEAGEAGELKSAMRISDFEGHFGGTPDGIGRGLKELPDQAVILEFKTHNDRSFNSLISDGLLKTKFQHYIQIQVLARKLNLEAGAYCAVNKDNDALHIELVKHRPEDSQRALEKAGRVINSPVPLPRFGSNPGSYGCKFCIFNRLCYFGDVQPDVNCRTCEHSQIGKFGSWHCNLHNATLPESVQRTGCRNYSVKPELIGRQP